MTTKNDVKIAVVGATGNVGRALLAILSERGFASKNIVALASDRSAHREISYGEDAVLKVQPLSTFDFSNVRVVLSSAGSKVAASFADNATKAGAIVIDNSSQFRMEKDIPLLIPEVNAEDLELAHTRKIIANPNCSMIQLAVALKPLDDVAKIKRVVVTTYQSVSGAGKKAMDELYAQTKAVFVNTPSSPEVFTKPIAFNVIPHIDIIDTSGDTGEEIKIMREFQKVMHRAIPISATAVRVPVFIGHGMSVNVEFFDKISPSEARNALKKAPGVSLFADVENYITPAEIAGEDAVFVSRLRKDPSVENGLNMWVVADNLRKGAALNAVQILELLLKKKMV